MNSFYKTSIFIFIAACISIVLLGNVLKKDIVIIDNNKEIHVQTISRNVGKLLSKYDIELVNADKVFPNVDSKLESGMEVQIIRSFPVKIYNGEEHFDFYTTAHKVEDILSEADIEINELDMVYPKISENIKADKKIEIIRVEKKMVNDEGIIPYCLVGKRTDSLKAGEIKIKNAGEFGKDLREYEVIYQNGEEISRTLMGQKNLVPAENEEILLGKEKYLVLGDGSPYRYSKVLNMVATAYDLSYASCGKNPGDLGYGITYSGTKARPGVVAVDPRVISLRSKLYIESLDYTKSYGFSSAEDTGSAIKGNRIDIFIGSNKSALRYGRRSVKVYVLDEVIDDSMMVGYTY